jgi:hypothetical protein
VLPSTEKHQNEIRGRTKENIIVRRDYRWFKLDTSYTVLLIGANRGAENNTALTMSTETSEQSSEAEYYELLEEYIEKFNILYTLHIEYSSLVTQHGHYTTKIDNLLDVLALLLKDEGDLDVDLLDNRRLEPLIKMKPELGDKLLKIFNNMEDESIQKHKETKLILENTPSDKLDWIPRFVDRLNERVKKYKGEDDNPRKRKLES